jgi:insertion element IS1 protein InsB
MTDEWEGFLRTLPRERHLYGKELTFPIEQTNSDIRHRLARFKRKTKATSTSADMVHKTLTLFHFFQDSAHHVTTYIAPLITFFS